MKWFFETLPLWFTVPTTILALVIITIALVKGVKFSYKDVQVTTGTESDKKPNAFSGAPQEWTIPAHHLIQFRKLRTDIKEDILVVKGDMFAVFRSLFINAMKDAGIGHRGIELHKDVTSYTKALTHVLDTVFDPMMKKTIFGNHFPTKRENESDTEYELRFFNTFSLNTALTILRLSRNDVTTAWDIESVIRSDYENKYIMSNDFLNIITHKVGDLVVKCRERRDHVFRQIEVQDGTTIETLKFEWEMVYG